MPQLDDLLGKLVKCKASDLHLSADQPVRMRIHGELEVVGSSVTTADYLLDILKEICNPSQWARFEENNELDFAYGLQGVGRFRCNYLQSFRGPGAVFRVIPEEIIPIEKLAVPPALLEFASIPRGLVLVTGPTGSGKSTTLASLIDKINREQSRHIITIEDPIEFVHANKRSCIVQREVGQHTTNFARALKDALREDPDVILVGEMRDLETIGLAVSAAEMGILVFGTLHTNSAPKTIDRIIDVFPSSQQEQIRSMLAESLKASASQQLLRRKGGSGRVASIEVLVNGPGLSNLIRDGSINKIYSYMQSNKSLGMQTMDEALMALVSDEIIAPEDAFLKASDKRAFEEWCKERGFKIDT